MEKLELKHLAPYLPYDLKIIWNDTKEVYLIGFESETDFQTKTYPISTLIFSMDKRPQDLGFKLILRLLSDLTISGYHFIYDQETDFLSICDWIKLDYESKLTCKFSYEFWSLLFDNHFDVFGLIEKGLAIDINTL